MSARPDIWLTSPFTGLALDGRVADQRIEEVEPNATFAFSATLAAVEAFRHGLVAFQMAPAACQAACSNPLRLGDGSFCILGHGSHGDDGRARPFLADG